MEVDPKGHHITARSDFRRALSLLLELRVPFDMYEVVNLLSIRSPDYDEQLVELFFRQEMSDIGRPFEGRTIRPELFFEQPLGRERFHLVRSDDDGSLNMFLASRPPAAPIYGRAQRVVNLLDMMLNDRKNLYCPGWRLETAKLLANSPAGMSARCLLEWGMSGPMGVSKEELIGDFEKVLQKYFDPNFRIRIVSHLSPEAQTWAYSKRADLLALRRKTS